MQTQGSYLPLEASATRNSWSQPWSVQVAVVPVSGWST